jgi:hypothetical protein
MLGPSRARFNIRWVPWLLALAGLAVPLIGMRFVVWLPSILWLIVLAAIWLLARVPVPRNRGARITMAVALLPVLFQAAWVGGWYLIPADLAWLAIEIAEGDSAGKVESTGEVVGRTE